MPIQSFTTFLTETDTALPMILAKEAALLLRRDLKRAFPTTTFRVSASHTMTVAWTDGPTVWQVKALTAKYEGRDPDPITRADGSQGRAQVLVFTERNASRDLCLKVVALLVKKGFAWAHDVRVTGPATAAYFEVPGDTITQRYHGQGWDAERVKQTLNRYLIHMQGNGMLAVPPGQSPL